ncbi:MAG: hypothetical protein M5E90_03815, partial [Asgard group archaeon]|nr:hypothetical protein [Asgard group archaeon]
ATRSRQTSGSSTTSAVSSTNNDGTVSQTEQVPIPPTFQSQNVQTIFNNFDNMNQYAKKNQQDQEQYINVKKESLGELFDSTSLVKFKSSTVLPKNAANLQRMATPKEEVNKEIGEVPGGNLTSDYMPGLFDKLDAQIFGKILPPYMLEKNESLRRNMMNNNQALGGQILSNQGQLQQQQQQQLHQPQMPQLQHPGINNLPPGGGSNWPIVNGEDGLNLEALFGSLGGNVSNQGDSNGLEYLDPF